MSSGKSSPLDIAKELGRSVAGEIGELAFLELEIAYALGLLPRFVDNALMRMSQNVLFYWTFGFFKSTILKLFIETIPKTIGVKDISSMTMEKIFGSINEKGTHIHYPAFTSDIRFCTISELAAFLGKTNAKQFADNLNIVLEGEKVTREMLKLGRGEIDEEELNDLKMKGVHYDPVAGSLSYYPNVSILAATRPLENKIFSYLQQSGFFSRFHVIQFDISEKDAIEYFSTDYSGDENKLGILRNINESLSKIKVKVIKAPKVKMDCVYDNIIEVVKDESSVKLKKNLQEIINPRLKGDINRELVGHAFLRTAFENNYQDIDSIDYTEDDVKFVLERPYHFVEFALDPLVAHEYTAQHKRVNKGIEIEKLLVEFLSDGSCHKREDALEYVKGRIPVSKSRIDKVLKNLVDKGKIDNSKHGFYILKRGEQCE